MHIFFAPPHFDLFRPYPLHPCLSFVLYRLLLHSCQILLKEINMLASSIRTSRRLIHHTLYSSHTVHPDLASTTQYLNLPSISPHHHQATVAISKLPSCQFSSIPATAPSIKLYQYHICPFCNITKSAMQYANLDYESVEVNPLTKAELKPW